MTTIIKIMYLMGMEVLTKEEFKTRLNYDCVWSLLGIPSPSEYMSIVRLFVSSQDTKAIA